MPSQYLNYNIEFKVYQIFYKHFVAKIKYELLEKELKHINKIYDSLSDELKYVFMLVSGRMYFNHRSHEEGIERLNKAIMINPTGIPIA